VAGVVGTAGGITSLVAYPALLATGLSPLAANVTNSVALLGGNLTAATRTGPDIDVKAVLSRGWVFLVVVSSVVGALTLTLTPVEAFDRIVPFLVALGAVVVLLPTKVVDHQQGDHRRRWSRPARSSGFAGVGLYNGYFGAGAAQRLGANAPS
jgi:uncharacterized membrane protein YfcA